MSTNSIIAQMNALSFDDEQKKQREKYKADIQADIDADGAVWDSQINSTQKYYDKQIDDKEAEYATDYQKNAVQKLINEKQIAERNANLGLTDSGLNRTQQTAAQLSYANQKGKIDLARQSALDNLTLAMTDAITTLQNQKAASARNITNQWNNYADTQAQNIYNTKYNGYVDMYNAQAEADAAVQKAATEAAAAERRAAENTTPQKIYWFRGVSDKNNNYLYYNTETGKTEEVPPYMNPYTSNDNRIAYSAEYKDKNIGFFELANGTTGYQPRGLKNEGGRFTPATAGGQVIKYDLYNNGKNNTVWESKTGKYFIWDDINNRYLDLTNQIIALFPNIE